MFPSEMPGLSWRDPSSQLCVFFQGRSAHGFSRVKRSLGDRVLCSVGGCNLAPGARPLLQVHLWGVTVTQRGSFDSDWLPDARPTTQVGKNCQLCLQGVANHNCQELERGQSGSWLGVCFVVCYFKFPVNSTAQAPSEITHLPGVWVAIHYMFLFIIALIMAQNPFESLPSNRWFSDHDKC